MEQLFLGLHSIYYNSYVWFNVLSSLFSTYREIEDYSFNSQKPNEQPLLIIHTSWLCVHMYSSKRVCGIFRCYLSEAAVWVLISWAAIRAITAARLVLLIQQSCGIGQCILHIHKHSDSLHKVEGNTKGKSMYKWETSCLCWDGPLEGLSRGCLIGHVALRCPVMLRHLWKLEKNALMNT